MVRSPSGDRTSMTGGFLNSSALPGAAARTHAELTMRLTGRTGSSLFHVEGEIPEASFALDLQHDGLAALAPVDAPSQRVDGFDGDAVEGVDGVAGQQTAVHAVAVERARQDDDTAWPAQMHHLPDLVVHVEREDAELAD